MTRILQLCLVMTLATCVSVPSAIDGTWDFTYITPDGDLKATATLKAEREELLFRQNGQETVGDYKDGEFQIEVKDYYSGEAGYSADLILRGKVEGNEIRGKWTFDVYSGTFSAKRSGS